MTVQELIDHLSKFPRNLQVIRTFCSDYDAVEADQIALIPAEDKRIALRQGRYITYHPIHWPLPSEEAPVFVSVIHFSGN